MESVETFCLGPGYNLSSSYLSLFVCLFACLFVYLLNSIEFHRLSAGAAPRFSLMV